uniref:Uncharacterized protein n=1 Tax=Glossina pallidipes TaxID=7398 RepID=A0A1B0A7J6_GLOPL
MEKTAAEWVTCNLIFLLNIILLKRANISSGHGYVTHLNSYYIQFESNRGILIRLHLCSSTNLSSYDHYYKEINSILFITFQQQTIMRVEYLSYSNNNKQRNHISLASTSDDDSESNLERIILSLLLLSAAFALLSPPPQPLSALSLLYLLLFPLLLLLLPLK